MSQQINLYSPLFRKQQKLFTSQAMVQALGLVLVALIVSYGYARYQVAALSRQANEFDAQLRAGLERVKLVPAAAVPADEKQLDARIAELEGRLYSAEQLLGQATGGRAGQAYAEALRALARQRMDGVWLTSITLTGDGRELSLVGRALRADLVPPYIDRLSKDPVLQGRQFATLAIERDAASKPPAGNEAPLAPDSVVFRLMASAGAGDR